MQPVKPWTWDTLGSWGCQATLLDIRFTPQGSGVGVWKTTLKGTVRHRPPHGHEGSTSTVKRNRFQRGSELILQPTARADDNWTEATTVQTSR